MRVELMENGLRGFGVPDDEPAVLAQRVVQARDHAPRRFFAKINQHVAAQDEVETRRVIQKRGVTHPRRDSVGQR